MTPLEMLALFTGINAALLLTNVVIFALNLKLYTEWWKAQQSTARRAT